MIYPVDNYLTEWNNSAGYDHGDSTSYGFHDGKDINDSGGGDSDLGKPLYAISKGTIIGIHEHIVNFGKHFFLQIDGAWGTRYVHYAHCNDIFVSLDQVVEEGQKIATVGKSGTPYAHCHFSIKKKPNGMDTIATTKAYLDEYWEDPIAFIEKYKTGGDDMANMYRGYDLSNPDSMKVAVDILIRVQQGEFVDKPKYDALEREAVELRKRPVSCPPVGDPKAAEKLKQIKAVVTDSGISKIINILNT